MEIIGLDIKAGCGKTGDMKPKPNESAVDYLARIGRKGGRVKSEAKTAANRKKGEFIRQLVEESRQRFVEKIK